MKMAYPSLFNITSSLFSRFLTFVIPMEAVMGETGEGSKEGSDSSLNKTGMINYVIT